MVTTECTTQMTLFEGGTQDVTADFEGGQIVPDAGLLAVRMLDLEIGIAGGRLPALMATFQLAVGHELATDVVQMPLAQHHEMVQALLLDRRHESFDVGIQVR